MELVETAAQPTLIVPTLLLSLNEKIAIHTYFFGKSRVAHHNGMIFFQYTTQ